MAKKRKNEPVSVQPELNSNGKAYKYYFDLGRYPDNYEIESKRGKRWQVRHGSYSTQLEAYTAGLAEVRRLNEKYHLQREIFDESAEIEKRQREHFDKLGQDMFSQQMEPPPESNYQSTESDEPGKHSQPEPTAETQEKQDKDADARLQEVKGVQNGASKPGAKAVEPSDSSQQIGAVHLKKVSNGYQWTIAGKTRQFFGKAAKYEAVSAGYHLLIERAELDNKPEEKKRLQAEQKEILETLQNGAAQSTEGAARHSKEAKPEKNSANNAAETHAHDIEARKKPEHSKRGSEHRAESEPMKEVPGGKNLRTIKNDISENHNPRPIKFDISREASTDAVKRENKPSQKSTKKKSKRTRRPIKFDISREALQDKGKRADDAYLFLRNWIDSCKESELKDSEKILADFLLFLDFQNGGDTFCITLSTIARKKGWSEQKAGRILKVLDDLDIIDKKTIPVLSKGKVIGKKIRIKFKLKFA